MPSITENRVFAFDSFNRIPKFNVIRDRLCDAFIDDKLAIVLNNIFGSLNPIVVDGIIAQSTEFNVAERIELRVLIHYLFKADDAVNPNDIETKERMLFVCLNEVLSFEIPDDLFEPVNLRILQRREARAVRAFKEEARDILQLLLDDLDNEAERE